jgi:hypothetical protein
VERNKPLGYMNTSAYQYLIFNNITLGKSVSSPHINFYDIAGSGLTDAVENDIYSTLATDISMDGLPHLQVCFAFHFSYGNWSLRVIY